ncbi:helix-turn-helix domain-containing protein [Streptomyces sp. MNU76]|uniref:helix-turn-helix domain-containing protein n=1 Tax=Streptomyces sp. MNU76 TaxID=2560026 RepID=UPI001E56E92F|nr:helix-turn-helix transcriptional regulator [Streptomyces sp. MNU76]MCC9712039.1 helix-turn-helix domain-containing protein [Streptomyces sp. MNU76]
MEPRRNQDPGRVRRKRIQAGLNQTTLALKAGISKNHMSQVERGVTGASPRVLKQLADVLGCEIADLMPPEPTVSESAA